LAAVDAFNTSGTGDIWTSTDSGATWTNDTTGTSASGKVWLRITSSAGGTKLAAIVQNGDIWTSTDSGATWTNESTTTSATGLDWGGITSSSDGTKLAAVETDFSGTGDIWTSTDSGQHWLNRTTGTSATGLDWGGITSSSDGTKLAAYDHQHNTGDIWTSTDSGATWTDQTASRNGVSDPLWDSVVSSSDGAKLAVAEINDNGATTTGDILTSSDGGVTWTNQTVGTIAGGNFFYRMAGSSDLTKLAVDESPFSGGIGDIWTGVIPAPPPSPTPAPVVASSGGGGWSGGCSTYPQGELPSWGVIPCTPTNSNQGPPVLPASIKTPSVSSLASSPSATSSSSAISFPTNHQLYDVSSDIKLLQQFLNAHAFTVAPSGPGSPGEETTFFGMKTYQALVKFQHANNLPATGYLGPMTRAALASLSPTSTAQ
jgi:hypothetical protein